MLKYSATVLAELIKEKMTYINNTVERTENLCLHGNGVP